MIFVPGRPVPQGSLKFIHGRPIHERATDLAVWRADIARAAAGLPREIEAVAVKLTFVMLKPKTVKRDLPWVRPDIDKLCRAVLDGLTGVAYEDDQQVVSLTAEKIYGDPVGVFISVRPIA